MSILPSGPFVAGKLDPAGRNSGCADRAEAVRELGRRGGALGLVHSETSVPSTPAPRSIRVDRCATRLKRLRTSVITAARLQCQQVKGWKVAMLTLTYRPEVDQEAQQIADCLRSIRKYLARRDVRIRYVWVQEFTRRGRPHYHVLLWLPRGITLPKPDKRGWWPHGLTRIEWARNAVGYIAKYASKGDALHQPAPGARMHGSGGLTDDELLEQRWWKRPLWMRDRTTMRDVVKRCRGGFVMLESGEFFECPWEVFFSRGDVWIRARARGDSRGFEDTKSASSIPE